MDSDKNAYDRILSTAEALVIEEGIAALTFDKISKRGRISRGGVLYHFPSKDALIEAMVNRFVERFERAIEELMARDPEPVGRLCRAYINASLPSDEVEAGQVERLCSSILAALNHSPERLEPLREQHRRWQQRIEDDGLDPVLATIIRHTVEGLWLGEAFTTNRIDPAMRAKVIQRLLALSRQTD